MSHQSNVMQAFVTRYDPEPAEENDSKKTEATEKTTSGRIEENNEGSSIY